MLGPTQPVPVWLATSSDYDLLLFLGVHVVFYVFYRLICVHRYDWESHLKGPTDEFNSVLYMLFTSTVVFYFGNYGVSYSYWTILTHAIGLLLFGSFTKVSFLRTDLRGYRTWDWKVWVIILIGLALGIAIAAYHIYLSYKYGIILSYLLLFCVPIFLFVTAYLVTLVTFPLRCRCCCGTRSNYVEAQPVVAPASQPQQRPPSKYPHVHFHLHHWTIFYCLAFFTRFPDVISQLSAGLCLGMAQQGLAAYKVAPPFFP